MYLILEGQLEKFEAFMKRIRNSIFQRVLMLTLTISDFCVTNFKANTSYEYAKHLRSITEHIDKEMAAEVAIKARFHEGEDDSDGLPEVTNVAESAGAYNRRKTAQPIRPKEGMYQPI